MYKTLRTVLPVLLFLLLVATASAEIYGRGLNLNKATPLSSIMADPDAWVGKTVQLEGLIVDVCESRGCWLYISGDKPFEKIRVKVVDGKIVFPLEARGKRGTVEGVVERFDLTQAEVIKRRQHQAQERGQGFDPASVTSGETFYQLRGLGADIPL